MSSLRESKVIEGFGKASNLTDLLDDDKNKNEKGNKNKKEQRLTIISKYLSYIVPLVIEVIVFILTFIIQKGVFDTIEYSSDDNCFIIRKYDTNNTIIKVTATQEELDKIGIIVPLESFINGIKNRLVWEFKIPIFKFITNL